MASGRPVDRGVCASPERDTFACEEMSLTVELAPAFAVQFPDTVTGTGPTVKVRLGVGLNIFSEADFEKDFVAEAESDQTTDPMIQIFALAVSPSEP